MSVLQVVLWNKGIWVLNKFRCYVQNIAIIHEFHQPPIFTWVGGGREKWHIVCTLNSMVAEYVSAKFCEPGNHVLDKVLREDAD
jgi:hypothetical protein